MPVSILRFLKLGEHILRNGGNRMHLIEALFIHIANSSFHMLNTHTHTESPDVFCFLLHVSSLYVPFQMFSPSEGVSSIKKRLNFRVPGEKQIYQGKEEIIFESN